MGRFLLIRMVLVLFGGGLALGCASSESAADNAAAQAAVIGTWEYEVNGVAPLNRGVFRITRQGDRLRGVIRDQRIGRLRARVDVRSSRLELVLSDLRISGFIEDDQFTAYLRRQQWSVTTRSPNRRRSRRQSASLHARRVQSAAAVDGPSTLACRPLLREANECN